MTLSKSRLRILLSNDDGIEAPGLKALWEPLFASDLFDLFIVAPASEKSGAGVSITWNRPLAIRRTSWEGSTPAWAVDGSPADCVKMAYRVLLDQPPDLIISGINAGSNAGRNILHSGTIGAVIEGVLKGIPGIALSCENGREPNFGVAQKYIVQIVNYLLEHPLPTGSLLNVNVPHVAKDEVLGFRLTRNGRGRWVEEPTLHLATDEDTSYWLGGRLEEIPEEEDSDIALLAAGYLTAVPIHIHSLTDEDELQKRREAFSQAMKKAK